MSSNNIFAALNEAKKTKKKDKDSKKLKDKKKGANSAADDLAFDEAFWSKQESVKVDNWADCDDDEDFLDLGPLPDFDNVAKGKPAEEEHVEELLVEENDMVAEEPDVDEADDQEETNEGLDDDSTLEEAVPAEKKPELEQQLSKKELKKREMEELDAVLAELGLQSSEQPEAAEAPQHPLEGEGKKSKRQMKKEKKAAAEAAAAVFVNGDGEKPVNGLVEAKPTEPQRIAAVAEPVELVDPRAALKKLSSKSKTKGSGPSAAATAAKEAAARKAKLAKDKKKDKSNYNQAPTR